MSAIERGELSWSGENPGIYLRDAARPDAPWSALALYFKVVVSAWGRGRGILLLGEPAAPAGYPAAPNVCVTDNMPLMKHLLEHFVPSFGAFRQLPSLPHITLLPATGGSTHADDPTAWGESIEAQNLQLRLNWRGLQRPFAANVGPESSATGAHRMYSVFQGAQHGEILLNGQELPGQPVERDFLGGRLSSAFLAFGESWIEALRDPS